MRWDELTDYLESEIQHHLDHDSEPKLEYSVLKILELHTPRYEFMDPMRNGGAGLFWIEECKVCDTCYPCPTARIILDTFEVTPHL